MTMMDSKNTPTYKKLWHRGFISLVLAEMLLLLSVYLLWVPVLSAISHAVSPFKYSLWVLGGYVAGLFLLGMLCNWLIQKYRRHHVYSWSVFTMMLIMFLIELFMRNEDLSDYTVTGWQLGLISVVIGSLYGLAQMVLTSTLVIDKCESPQRTGANHYIAWCGRVALPLAFMLSMTVTQTASVSVLIVSMAAALGSILLVQSVKFPFRVPEEAQRIFSLDRFFLLQGCGMFVVQLLAMVCVGLLLMPVRDMLFYLLLLAGVFVAALYKPRCSERCNAQPLLRGFVLLCCTIICHMLFYRYAPVQYLVPVALGISVGVIGKQSLQQLLDLSDHCQRGTSQSTYMLATEAGIAIGLSAGMLLSVYMPRLTAALALCTALSAMLLYLYMRHHNNKR